MFIIDFLKSLFGIKKQKESNNKEMDLSNENNNISDISESSVNDIEIYNTEKDKKEEIYTDKIDNTTQTDINISEKQSDKNYIDLTFSLEDISDIRNILKPIIRSYNYEKKDIFYSYSENVKLIKCFITNLDNSFILVVRPTQSDIYNKTIEFFVEKCIFEDFKNALKENNINNLDIETYCGKIIIKKKNIK